MLHKNQKCERLGRYEARNRTYRNRRYNALISKGVHFAREPKVQDYGIVAVFEDLYGNKWDLLQLNEGHRIFERIASMEA